jgi:isoleucyl-tRNA synthetase
MSYRTFKNLNLPEIDREILQFWEEKAVFDKSIKQRAHRKSFVFYEGPPSANGKPGIHHVMARTVKDIFCRFQTMNGHRVERKGGWDTHGLPIELSVETKLGITKEDIGKTISVDDYNKACKETVMLFKNEWDKITIQMGYWVDLEKPYITYENDYIESVWWLLKRLYDKNLLYKGYTIQPYSPAAGTGLSTHELNMPGCYQNIKDTSIVAQFDLVRNDASEFLFGKTDTPVSVLAWTTTPWTLPANCALAVGEKIEYVLVRTFNPYTFLPVTVLLAKDLFRKYFSEKNDALRMEDYVAGAKNIPFKIVGEVVGKELKGLKYNQLLPYVAPKGKAFEIIIGDFVTTSDGTGIVHTASVFGADDFRVCKENGIASIMVTDENGDEVPLVDKRGRFVVEVTDFAGEPVKEQYLTDKEKKEWLEKNHTERYLNVDERIAIKLKKENKAFKVERYEHSYPHCWRTGKPVLYYPLDSWFVKSTAAKQRMVELNKTIHWKPAATGTGRFGQWLENLQDWNLSRSRYWGIPLPIWRTEDKKQEICIGSVADLQKEVTKANKVLHKSQELPKDFHRPYIDQIVLVAENGEPMFRELDLIDVWFDSGAMPYAQWHYPFENKEKFKQNFPADFIAEGVDQTRGWFFTLHAIAVMAFDSIAFKNVVSNGLVLDKEGKKMSKSLGNTVNPFETLDKYGADATRWYMIANAQPWDNLKFDIEGIGEVQRKFFGTLYNTYSFFALYANVDNFKHLERRISLSKRAELDRWIISLLNTLVKEVHADFADYEPTNAARKIQQFVDEHLSNWYVRLSRRRFWKGEYEHDKIAAYQTLYECLVTITRLSAPIAPFFSDWLFKNLNDVTQKDAHESVHLTDFPDFETKYIDASLEKRMNYAQRISGLILSLRKKEKIRVRQPLRRALLPILDESFIEEVESIKDLILAETNVKILEYVRGTEGLVKKKIRPNFKSLGKRLGANLKSLGAQLDVFGQKDISLLEKTGKCQLILNGTPFDFTTDDFLITSEDIPGWQSASDGELTLALDLNLDAELLAEGTARDLVNRIQNIRKERAFNVTDRVTVTLERHKAIQDAVAHFADYIKAETLATDLVLSDAMTSQPIELMDGVSLGIEVVLN